MTANIAAIRAKMEEIDGHTPGPWYTHNLPGDWGLRGAYSIHVACANPHEWDPCIAQVEYQTPYCLGKKAARTAACNARLIAAAPDMRATILALCDTVDTLRADNDQLRTALTKINVGDGWAAQIARAALAQKGGE